MKSDNIQGIIDKFLEEHNVDPLNDWAISIHDRACSMCENNGSTQAQSLYNEVANLVDNDWRAVYTQQRSRIEEIRNIIYGWNPGERLSEEEKNKIGIVQSVLLNTILNEVIIKALAFFGKNETFFPGENIDFLKNDYTVQQALAALQDYVTHGKVSSLVPNSEVSKNIPDTIKIAQYLFKYCATSDEFSAYDILIEWAKNASGYDKFLRLFCINRSFLCNMPEKEASDALFLSCITYKTYLEENLSKCLKKEDPSFFGDIFVPQEEDVLVLKDRALHRERRKIFLGWQYLVELSQVTPNNSLNTVRDKDCKKLLTIFEKNVEFKLGFEKYQVVHELLQLLPSEALLPMSADSWIRFFDFLEEKKQILASHRRGPSLFNIAPSKGGQLVADLELIRDTHWCRINERDLTRPAAKLAF